MGIPHEEIQKKKLAELMYRVYETMSNIDSKYFEPQTPETLKVQNIYGLCIAYLYKYEQDNKLCN